MRGVFAAAAIAAATLPAGVQAAGLLTPSDSSAPGASTPLDIRSHDVDVVVQDGYVITEVEQVFSNPHSQDLQALYAFPIPENALVTAFTVWIDGNPVVGEVLEKDKARQVYEEEKNAGREAGLTEQNSFKRFEISVSPVRAMSDTRIKLQYMQVADIDTGIGRYVYPLEEGGTDDEKLAFWTSNEIVKERFSFNLHLRSAYPVDAVRLPNHPDALVTKESEGEWRIEILRNGGTATTSSPAVDDDTDQQDVSTLAQSGYKEEQTGVVEQNFGQQFASGLDNDIVLYWRLSENAPASLDLTAYKAPGAANGTFMMVMTPGDDLPVINQGRDWMFVLDISGSMQGKYHTLVEGVNRALTKMHDEDRFRIVLFNKNARELTQGWTPATNENVQRYINKVRNTQPNGGTNLFEGIAQGASGLDADRTTGIVLVTDGVANVGHVGNKHFLKLLAKQDVRLFTFIMGNEANRPLLESLTDYTNGFAINISNNDDIVGKLLEATQKINHQAMHNVRVDISGVRTSDITPELFGTVYRGEQLVVMGKYAHAGEVIVDLKAEISGQPVEYSTRFNLPDMNEENPELERLWAFAKIQGLKKMEDLLGADADRQSAMTDIALDHGIVTEKTSMLVIREEQFVARNIERRNKKRVELENSAQQQRKSQPVTQRRVDNSQSASKPMFEKKRATYSSGGSSGAFDSYWLLLLTPMAVALLRKRLLPVRDRA